MLNSLLWNCCWSEDAHCCHGAFWVWRWMGQEAIASHHPTAVSGTTVSMNITPLYLRFVTWLLFISMPCLSMQMVLSLWHSGLFFLPVSVQPAFPLMFGWQWPLLGNTHCVNLPVPLSGAAKVLFTLAALITSSLLARIFHSNTLGLLILPFIYLQNSSLVYFNHRIYHICLPFLPLHQCCCFSPIEGFIPCSQILLLELIAWFPSSSLVHALVNICWFYLI